MAYDYSNIHLEEQKLLPIGYKGNVYNMSYKWKDIIKPTYDAIKILEIGAYHGANVCCLTQTHALNSASQIHCVDPWYDYDAYPEYRHHQATNYAQFIRNISKMNACDIAKIYLHRVKSEEAWTRFADEMFDIIYIDGNHERNFVFEDALMSLKKVKKEGWIVFDDAHDKQVMEAIQIFMLLYKDSFYHEVITKNGQVFLKRRV